MRVKGIKVFSNGARGGYVYYKNEKKWKWRIISGPRKKKKGGVFRLSNTVPTSNLKYKIIFNEHNELPAERDRYIILIPGWLCDVENSYWALIELLTQPTSKNNSPILLYDPPGIGMNKEFAKVKGKNQCNVLAQAQSLARIIISERLTNVNLVGHSLGGIVAMLTNKILIEEEYNNICSVTLLDPTGPNSRLNTYMTYIYSVICKTRSYFSSNKPISNSRLGKLLHSIITSFPREVKDEAMTIPMSVVCQTVEGFHYYLSEAFINECINFLPDNTKILLTRGSGRVYGNFNVNNIVILNSREHFIQLYDFDKTAKEIIDLTNNCV